jgi:hypothetical protein
MKATLVLCDHVAVADGKLYINGGGWNVTGPKTSPMGLAILVEVPLDRANQSVPFRVSLVDADGHPVTQPSPGGDASVQIEGQLEVGRPAGATPGSALNVPLALNLPPMQLPPSSRFEWRLVVDDVEDHQLVVPFTTRPE